MGNVSGSVHEAGKSIDKTETLFSQERDPRFSDMYTGISGCMYQKKYFFLHMLFVILVKQSALGWPERRFYRLRHWEVLKVVS